MDSIAAFQPWLSYRFKSLLHPTPPLAASAATLASRYRFVRCTSLSIVSTHAYAMAPCPLALTLNFHFSTHNIS